MKILLLGANGQVGWHLSGLLAPLGQVWAMGRTEADLSDLDGLRALVDALSPDVIVNAAAYTAVDRAESEPEAAWRVNAEAPALLAGLARETGAWLVHYSTDYVFDGTKAGFYTETDVPNPVNAYGHSKLEGDQQIMESGCRHLIFRTSWVFAARGHNFARTILNLAQQRDTLGVVADQTGCPTSAEYLAAGTALCLHRLCGSPEGDRLSGLYNVVPEGETTWYDYAVYLLRGALQRGWDLKLRSDNVRPLATREYPLPAARLANSRLSTEKLKTTFGIVPPCWTYYVDRVLDDWSESRG